MKKFISLSFLFAIFLAWSAGAHSAEAATDVVMTKDTLTINGVANFDHIPNIDNNADVVWTVTFGGGAQDQTVLLDLEIKNPATMTRYAQNYWDNVLIPAGSSKTVSITMPKGLPPAQYSFSAGVFDPGWQGLRYWYKAQRAANVTGTASLPDVVYDHSTFQASVPAGTTDPFTVYIKDLNQTKTVLVDLELKDLAYNKYGQKYWDNVTIPANTTQAFSWDIPTTLPPGTYYLAVGIFDPQWKSLLHWYKYQETFTVTAGTPTPDIVLSSSSQTSANLTAGQSNTLSANVTNTGSGTTPVLVDLEAHNDVTNELINQVYSDNVPLSGTVLFTMNTPPLAAGSYRFSVGIFHPGWSGDPIHWYNWAQTFTVK